MEDNFDAEAAKCSIDSEITNVTEKNPIRELGKIIVGLAAILISAYIIIFFVSGIILVNLPETKRAQLEEMLTQSCKQTPIEISSADYNRLEKIKNNILNSDPDFPKSSDLKINIVKSNDINAYSYPNGNIDITEKLYDELKSDDELTFIIAHEMGHYKHKDHLMQLRRNIATGATIILFGVFNPNGDITKVASGSLELSDLSYSRTDEMHADKYAIDILNKIYGNAIAGVTVMEILKEKNKFNIEFMSTHPDLDRRIKYIEKYSN